MAIFPRTASQFDTQKTHVKSLNSIYIRGPVNKSPVYVLLWKRYKVGDLSFKNVRLLIEQFDLECNNSEVGFSWYVGYLTFSKLNEIN